MDQWLQFVQNVGIAGGCLAFLLWYVVIPLKDGHVQFLANSTAATQKLVDTNVSLAETQRMLANQQHVIAGQQEQMARQLAQVATDLNETSKLLTQLAMKLDGVQQGVNTLVVRTENVVIKTVPHALHSDRG